MRFKFVLPVLFGVLLLLDMGRSVSYAITIDGNKADWSGITPIITDPLDSLAPDFLSLSVTDDASSVFFLYEFASIPSSSAAFLLLDTDTNSSTGFSTQGIGMEYGIVVLSPNPVTSYIGDARDGAWGPTDFPGALSTALGSTFWEFSVPISTLQILTPTISAFDIRTNNDTSTGASYTLSQAAIPEPATVALLGIGLAGFGGMYLRRRRKKDCGLMIVD